MDHSYSHAEKLQAVCVACEAPDLPNVRAVAAALTAKDPTQNVVSLEGSARACIDPAIQWFLQKFNVQLYDLVAAFKAARIMCPVAVQWLRSTVANVSALRIFPFLDSDIIIDGLNAEQPNYIAVAQDVKVYTEEKKVKWWKQHAELLPC